MSVILSCGRKVMNNLQKVLDLINLKLDTLWNPRCVKSDYESGQEKILIELRNEIMLMIKWEARSKQ